MSKTEFGGRQGTDLDYTSRPPLHKSPPAAPEGGAPTSGANFLPAFPLPWIREYAERLHSLFKRVETLREQGLSLDQALRRRWYGPRWHTARRVKVRLGPGSLRVRYYYWRRSGRTPECLALRFPSTTPPLPPEIVLAFVEACAVAGVTHFSQAVRLINSQGLSYRRVLIALPDQVLRAIRETFAARRQAEIEARKRVRQFQGQTHRALAAEAARGRKLARLAGMVYRASGRRGDRIYLPEARGGCSDLGLRLQCTPVKEGERNTHGGS